MLRCRCAPVALHDEAERGELAWPIADEWLARSQAACLPVELALQAKNCEGRVSLFAVFKTFPLHVACYTGYSSA